MAGKMPRYSLYSTDSEVDQVGAAQRGFNRCANLLKTIASTGLTRDTRHGRHQSVKTCRTKPARPTQQSKPCPAKQRVSQHHNRPPLLPDATSTPLVKTQQRLAATAAAAAETESSPLPCKTTGVNQKTNRRRMTAHRRLQSEPGREFGQLTTSAGLPEPGALPYARHRRSKSFGAPTSDATDRAVRASNHAGSESRSAGSTPAQSRRIPSLPMMAQTQSCVQLSGPAVSLPPPPPPPPPPQPGAVFGSAPYPASGYPSWFPPWSYFPPYPYTPPTIVPGQPHPPHAQPHPPHAQPHPPHAQPHPPSTAYNQQQCPPGQQTQHQSAAERRFLYPTMANPRFRPATAVDSNQSPWCPPQVGPDPAPFRPGPSLPVAGTAPQHRSHLRGSDPASGTARPAQQLQQQQQQQQQSLSRSQSQSQSQSQSLSQSQSQSQSQSLSQSQSQSLSRSGAHSGAHSGGSGGGVRGRGGGVPAAPDLTPLSEEELMDRLGAVLHLEEGSPGNSLGLLRRALAVYKALSCRKMLTREERCGEERRASPGLSTADCLQSLQTDNDSLRQRLTLCQLSCSKAESAKQRLSEERQALQQEMAGLRSEVSRLRQAPPPRPRPEEGEESRQSPARLQAELEMAQAEVRMGRMALAEKEGQLSRAQDQALALRHCIAGFLTEATCCRQSSSAHQAVGWKVPLSLIQTFQELADSGNTQSFLDALGGDEACSGDSNSTLTDLQLSSVQDAHRVTTERQSTVGTSTSTSPGNSSSSSSSSSSLSKLLSASLRQQQQQPSYRAAAAAGGGGGLVDEDVSLLSEATTQTSCSERQFRTELATLDSEIARLQLQFRTAAAAVH